MKIRLDASIKEHREIGLVLKAIVCPDNEYFVEWIDGLEYRACHKITIDLDQAQMDLRLALGTDIEFQLNTDDCIPYGKMVGVHIGSESVFTYLYEYGELYGGSVKLCPDYLISVGVEVEE